MRKKIFSFLACIFTCLFCMGCASTSPGRTDTTILEYQAQIDELKSGINVRDRAIENGIRQLDSISSRCEAETGTIDEIIELFDKYQRTVEQLLYDYYETNCPYRAEDTDNKHIAWYFNSEVYRSDSRLYYLCKGNYFTTLVRYIALKKRDAVCNYDNYSYYYTSL